MVLKEECKKARANHDAGIKTICPFLDREDELDLGYENAFCVLCKLKK